MQTITFLALSLAPVMLGMLAIVAAVIRAHYMARSAEAPHEADLAPSSWALDLNAALDEEVEVDLGWTQLHAILVGEECTTVVARTLRAERDAVDAALGITHERTSGVRQTTYRMAA